MVAIRFSGPSILLRLEGLTVLVAAGVAYHVAGFSAWKFWALLLAPDLAMTAYLFGQKVGTVCYNIAHSYVFVGLFWLLGRSLGLAHALPLCLIWLAHIGFDRLLGYGLKYASGFKETHLGRV